MSSLTLAVVLQVAVLGAPNEEYSAAYGRSLQTGRPLVVLLGADWCPGCRVMKGKVMPQVAMTGGLEGVEYVYVDIDRQRELGSKLSRAEAIPQLICFVRTPDGWRSGLLTGVQKPQKVVAFINAGRAQTASVARPTATLSSWKPPMPMQASH